MRFRPIRSTIGWLIEIFSLNTTVDRVAALETENYHLRQRIRDMAGEIDALKSNLGKLQTSVAALQVRVAGLSSINPADVTAASDAVGAAAATLDSIAPATPTP
jgi:hypothetical protein